MRGGGVGLLTLRTKLFTGTVPANKNYVTGTVAANKSYVTDTVKKGQVPKKIYIAMDPRVVRMPQQRNVVNSFIIEAGPACTVELYYLILFH